MTGPRPVLDGIDSDEAKTRKCLKCREEFPSRHYGERVCRKCKEGGDYQPARMRRMRPVEGGGE